MNELHKRYRPKDFGDVIGQDHIIEPLQKMIEWNKVPHAILLCGPKGCGKTTIGRILRRKLKCSKWDFIEQNCANKRGIENIREIESQVNLCPMKGKTKIWLLDECFIAGTSVETPNGPMNIEDLRPGDSVFSAYGMDTVKNNFVKEIPIDRILTVCLSNGTTLVCSDHHKFYTDTGWKYAKHLTQNDCVFGFDKNIMGKYSNHNCGRLEDENLSELWQRNARKDKNGEATNVLQPSVCSTLPNPWHKSVCSMRRVWQPYDNSSKEEISRTLLQPTLCSCEQNETSRNSKMLSQQSCSGENQESKKDILCKRDWQGFETTVFHTNAKKQPYEQSSCIEKDAKNKREKWNPSCLARISWWKRTIHKTTSIVERKIGEALENGIIHCYKKKKSIPTQIQCGYRKRKDKISCRNRWEKSSLEENYAKGCQENRMLNVIRVESVEIYQRGSNEQFEICCSNNPKGGKGTITLYDIEVENHPSFFANGVLVHNCHMMTGEASNAFLKVLEEPPSHVYFILCTTDPQKLITTIRSRCTEFAIKPMSSLSLRSLIEKIAEAEKIKLSEDVIDKIIANSDNSARNALVLLDKVSTIANEEKQLETIQKASTETAAIEIARTLFNPRASWMDMVKVLKSTETEEPESMRWMILGYAKAILLGGGKMSPRAYDVIQIFRDNWYDCKSNGLVACCYEAMTGK